MYTPIWNAVRAYLSAERMQAEIAEFFELSRWSSFDKLTGLAQLIAGRMQAIGLDDVRLIEFPADGRTSYGGWVMPRAYDVQEARLTLLEPEGSPAILADYYANPTSLMLYSLPTPPEGITAELVIGDSLDEMTPERLFGKLVLTSGIGVEYSQAARRAGAHGLISDCRNAHRVFKNGPEVDRTNEWHNYTIPLWDDPGKGFGFSISPEQGRRLRERLAVGQTLRLHALVQSRHYDGTLPVISGRLTGLEPEEIVLTGHFDEFGADDNCSQVTVALEVVRAIRAMLEAGEIPPLRRSIRVLLPMEVRGFNALIQNHDETKYLVAGLNIDTVGTDQNAVTSVCTLSENFAALPSYTEEFAAELLARTAEEKPLFRWRRLDAEMIDNIFGEPLIGAPTPSIWHYSATHHLATDTPDRISGRMLVDMARLTATYASFLANAGLNESLWLAQLTANQAISRFQAIAARNLRGDADTAKLQKQLASLHERYAQKIGSPGRLVPSVSLLPIPEVVAEQSRQFLSESRLLPRELFHARVAALKADLDRIYGETMSRMLRRAGEIFGTDTAEEDEPIPVSRCVPLKTFRGFAAFEDLNDADRETAAALEIAGGWGAAMWLQNALMFANGKRTAGEIAMLLRRHLNEGPPSYTGQFLKSHLAVR